MPILTNAFETVDFEPMGWVSSLVLVAGLDQEDRRQRHFGGDRLQSKETSGGLLLRDWLWACLLVRDFGQSIRKPAFDIGALSLALHFGQAITIGSWEDWLTRKTQRAKARGKKWFFKNYCE